MFRTLVLTAALVSAAACSGPPPKSEQELTDEAMQHEDTRAGVTAYFACLERVAIITPNGKTALDLDRLDRVTESCGPEKQAMEFGLARTFGELHTAENVSRLRGLDNAGRKIIREHPYEPPSATVADET